MKTKTEQKILNYFVAKINKKFTLQGIGKELDMHQALAYRSSKKLIKERLIIPDENGLYHLNYKENQQEIISSEYQRTSIFLKNQKHKMFINFIKEFIDISKEDNYILMLFGSAVEKDNPRDYDIVIYFDTIEKANKYENILHRLKENYNKIDIHINVDSLNDLNEMLIKRDENNIANESLNNHIIFYGAELFYKILKKVRPYA
jgi:hypothetical protein